MSVMRLRCFAEKNILVKTVDWGFCLMQLKLLNRVVFSVKSVPFVIVFYLCVCDVTLLSAFEENMLLTVYRKHLSLCKQMYYPVFRQRLKVRNRSPYKTTDLINYSNCRFTLFLCVSPYFQTLFSLKEKEVEVLVLINRMRVFLAGKRSLVTRERTRRVKHCILKRKTVRKKMFETAMLRTFLVIVIISKHQERNSVRKVIFEIFCLKKTVFVRSTIRNQKFCC